MIVEKLTDEDFDRFFQGRMFEHRYIDGVWRELRLSDAHSIRRVEDCGYVEIDFNNFGTFFFCDFDFHNCYYDGEFYNLHAYRRRHNLHDERWVEFMSNHPIYGEEWKRLYAERLEKENAKKQEDDLTR